jgi:hypothetical protein
MKRPPHVDLVVECPDCGEPHGARIHAEPAVEHPDKTWPEAIALVVQRALEHMLVTPCPHCESSDTEPAGPPDDDGPGGMVH